APGRPRPLPPARPPRRVPRCPAHRPPPKEERHDRTTRIRAPRPELRPERRAGGDGPAPRRAPPAARGGRADGGAAPAPPPPRGGPNVEPILRLTFRWTRDADGAPARDLCL